MATLIPTSRPGRLLWGLPWLRRTVTQAGTDSPITQDIAAGASQRRGIAKQGQRRAAQDVDSSTTARKIDEEGTESTHASGTVAATLRES